MDTFFIQVNGSGKIEDCVANSGHETLVVAAIVTPKTSVRVDAKEGSEGLGEEDEEDGIISEG